MTVVEQFRNIKDKLVEQEGMRKLYSKQKQELIKRKEDTQRRLKILLQSRAVAQEVAERTQKKLEFHISNLVSMALSSVFPEPYTFNLVFIQRRNKTEARLVFSKNGNETDDILNAAGGGVADVASLALRISLWSIKKTRPTMILDEAMKFLHSSEYQEKASQMMKEVCDKLGLQIILVSDQKDILKYADNVVEMKSVGGKTVTSSEENKKINIVRRRTR